MSVCLLADLTLGPIYVCCMRHTHHCLMCKRYLLDTHVNKTVQYLTNYPKPMVSRLNAMDYHDTGV
jgi:uncharacterized C2H2 Zn-finger protein